MNSPRIVGVILVRNEDRFLAQALENIAKFCDEFLMFDHGSTDQTPAIFKKFAASGKSVKIQNIPHPSLSHAALQPYANSRSWIFGVDGDEIYDPAGLALLRPRILGGEFDAHWMLMGHTLHVTNFADGKASGYMAPPSRSITKLYNFSAINAWPGRSMERLHGGSPVFRHGYDANKKRLLFEESSWDDSPLRCLHMCFCQRSSLDKSNESPRRNIDEIYNRGGFFRRLLTHFLKKKSEWKQERYRRGNLTEVESAAFFHELV